MFKPFVGVALAALFAVSAVAHAEDAGPIVIKFSHVVSDDAQGQGGAVVQKLAEGVCRARSRSRSTPTRRCSATPTRSGPARQQVQMLATSLSKFGPCAKQLQVFDLPFPVR